MNAISPPVLSEATVTVCFLCTLLIPCALGGLAMINAGLGRSRNVAHSALSMLCIAACAALTYFAIGFSWQGYIGQQEHLWIIGGKAWKWIGSERFLLRDIEFDGTARSLAVLFGIFAVTFSAAIPLGAVAERWRLAASCASTVWLAGFVFPLFANWVWGGGWLAQLGADSQLGHGFIDAGGASSIQAVGGLTALAVTWILGPRRGKYTTKGMPVAMPAHNAPFVLFGCFLTWWGYLGLNCAGAILFGDVDLGHVIVVPMNATLAAAAALLTAAALTRSRFGKADASLCANAWVAGLVACSAGCAIMRPAGAVLTGIVSGALVVFSVEWLELRFKVDDPGGAISVHGLCGIWGVLAVSFFGPSLAPNQWLAQIVGIATLLGFVFPVAYAANWLLDRVLHQRVAPEAERQGLDLHELGAAAYPDFMTHKDDL